MKLKHIFLAGVLALGTTSCDNLLEFPPQNEVLTADALKDPTTYQPLLNSAYDVLRGGGGGFLGGQAQTIAEVMGDNINPAGINTGLSDYTQYYLKTTSIFSTASRTLMQEPYIAVYRANVLLENVDGSTLPDADKRRIKGEALFLRGLCHFELVRFFANPYNPTGANDQPGIVVRLQSEATPRGRNTVKEVYDQVIKDLTDAIALLPNTNGVYATSWAAKAYLAKVQFHAHNFTQAFALADDVIKNSGVMFNTADTEFDRRFSVVGSAETILGMRSTGQSDNRGAGFTTIYRNDVTKTQKLLISRNFYARATANVNDKRGVKWYTVDAPNSPGERIFFNAFNNKDFVQVPLMHITELKFIRAEAAAQNNNLTQAYADINDIKTRAGLPSLVNGLPKQSVIQAIRDEKRLELFCEGHRFHDLRRIGALEGGVTINGAPWNCNGMTIQFPDREIFGAGDLIVRNLEGGCQ